MNNKQAVADFLSTAPKLSQKDLAVTVLASKFPKLIDQWAKEHILDLKVVRDAPRNSENGRLEPISVHASDGVHAVTVSESVRTGIPEEMLDKDLELQEVRKAIAELKEVLDKDLKLQEVCKAIAELKEVEKAALARLEKAAQAAGKLDISLSPSFRATKSKK